MINICIWPHGEGLSLRCYCHLKSQSIQGSFSLLEEYKDNGQAGDRVYTCLLSGEGCTKKKLVPKDLLSPQTNNSAEYLSFQYDDMHCGRYNHRNFCIHMATSHGFDSVAQIMARWLRSKSRFSASNNHQAPTALVNQGCSALLFTDQNIKIKTPYIHPLLLQNLDFQRNKTNAPQAPSPGHEIGVGKSLPRSPPCQRIFCNWRPSHGWATG